jgi:integrase
MATIVKGKNPRKPYTVRYWVNGRQRERSFAKLNGTAGANAYKTKVEYEARTQTFVDPKLASVSFADYATTVINGLAVTSGTKSAYLGLLRSWVAPWAGDRTLLQVSQDREGLAKLINQDMKNDATGKLLSYNRRGSARTVVLAAVDEAVRAGRLQTHRLTDIQLVQSEEIAQRRDFVFPTFVQIKALQDKLDASSLVLIIWLMRACGLRIREALAVNREDFRDGGTVLRITGQASINGDKKVPLKHRRAGQYRDVPVPAYLWAMVRDLPVGPVCPAADRLYFSYSTVYKIFIKARNEVGISHNFIPHSLRHAFASALLGDRTPITDVAAWLGHKTIDITYRIYGHLVPSAASKTRDVLEHEYEMWSQAA